MSNMFAVRCSTCPTPNLQTSPSLHAAFTIHHCRPARHLPGPELALSPRTVCPPFDSRQHASAFNQPLSFDTSSVTNMGVMFYYASAFNRPLSFDTSNVTTMGSMFRVRC